MLTNVYKTDTLITIATQMLPVKILTEVSLVHVTQGIVATAVFVRTLMSAQTAPGTIVPPMPRALTPKDRTVVPAMRAIQEMVLCV